MKVIGKKFRLECIWLDKLLLYPGWEAILRYHGTEWPVFLCVHTMARLFEIPVNTKAIWVSLHDRPASQRYEVKVYEEMWGSDNKYPVLSFVDFDLEYNDYPPVVERLLSPYIGKKLYVQVEY